MRLARRALVPIALFAAFLVGRSFSVRTVAPTGSGVKGAATPAAHAESAPDANSADRTGAGEETPLPEGLDPDELRNIRIFRAAAPSVVNVTSIALRRDFFSLDVMRIPQGTGSGFIWDEDGHVVTNFHVIQQGNAFTVTLANQETYDAEVTGFAEDKDLAVIKIKAPRSALRPIAIGHSHDLVVGQTVLAVGNPFGLDHSLTIGVVSALGRELQSPSGRTIHDVIQTDAAINPGNSGGPLLDSHGRVVGINSAIYSPSGTSAGIGFAVPADTVRRLVPQLIAHGHVAEPGIGISLVSNSVAEKLGLDGVLIYGVQRGSPAAAAGLAGLSTNATGRVVLGDRIVAVDGKKVGSGDDLLDAFERAGVDATVTLNVVREDRHREVTVKLVAVE